MSEIILLVWSPLAITPRPSSPDLETPLFLPYNPTQHLFHPFIRHLSTSAIINKHASRSFLHSFIFLSPTRSVKIHSQVNYLLLQSDQSHPFILHLSPVNSLYGYSLLLESHLFTLTAFPRHSVGALHLLLHNLIDHQLG